MSNPGPPAPSNRQLILSVMPSVVLPMFLSMADQSIVGAALPAIVGDLGGAEQVALLVTGYLVAVTIASPLYGSLGDALGRKRLIGIALCIFITASLLCAFANSLPMLIATRILQGFGAGGLMTLAQALIADVVPPKIRARYQGYLATVAVTSNSFGPIAGGFLTEYFGWRAIFLINLPLGLIALLLLRRLKVTTTHEHSGGFDFPGLAYFGLFIVSALTGLQVAQRLDLIALVLALGFAALAVVAIWLLIRREKRAPFPLLPLPLFRLPAIWRSDVIALCHGAAVLSLLTIAPLYFRMVHGASPAEIGLLLLPVTAGLGLGGITAGWLVSKTGRTAIFPSIGLTVAVALVAVVAFGLSQLTATQVSIALGFLSAGMGPVMGTMQLTAQMAGSGARMGTASASIQFSRSLGAALGTAVATTVFFAAITVFGGDAAQFIEAIVEAGPAALSGLPAEQRQLVETQVMLAFQLSFIAIGLFLLTGCVTVWSMPLRRV